MKRLKSELTRVRRASLRAMAAAPSLTLDQTTPAASQSHWCEGGGTSTPVLQFLQVNEGLFCKLTSLEGVCG
jgi:hypothetical protein